MVWLSNLYQAKRPETSYHNKSNQKELQPSSLWVPNKKGKWQGDIFWAEKNFFVKCILNLPNKVWIKIASMAFHTLFPSTKIIFQNSLHCVVPEGIFTPLVKIFFLIFSPIHSESSNLASHISVFRLTNPPNLKEILIPSVEINIPGTTHIQNQHFFHFQTGWKNNINCTTYVSVNNFFTNIWQFKQWKQWKPRQTISRVLFNWVSKVTKQLLWFRFYYDLRLAE